MEDLRGGVREKPQTPLSPMDPYTDKEHSRRTSTCLIDGPAMHPEVTVESSDPDKESEDCMVTGVDKEVAESRGTCCSNSFGLGLVCLLN